MFTPLIWLLWVVLLPSVIPVVVRWIYLPIKIRHSHPPSIRSGHSLTRVDSLTPEMRDLIANYVQQFSAEGFTVGANLSTDRGPKQARGVQVILINRGTGDIANLIIVSIGLNRNCTLPVEGKQPQPLLVAMQAQTLHKCRDAVAVALGIENSIIPPE